MKIKIPKIQYNQIPIFSLAILAIFTIQLMFITNPFSFIAVQGHLQEVDSDSGSNNNDEILIPSVPYVWQEVNGFCNWAAVTIMLDYYTDIESNLAQTLALSGAGWGFSYVRSGPTVMMLPGVYGSQMEDTVFIADLYGLDTCLTIIETNENLILEDYYADLGIEVLFLKNWEEAYNYLTSTLQASTPLLLSVNPGDFPFPDYKDYVDSNGAHAVVAVGYNSSHVMINEPGIGSLTYQYGFSLRGNYTAVTFSDFQKAWTARQLISMKFSINPSKIPANDELTQQHFIDRMTAKLSGNGYASGMVSPWKNGKEAFNALSSDFSIDKLSNWFYSLYLTFNANKTKLSQVCSSLGPAYASTMTLLNESLYRSYVAFSQAVTRYPEFELDSSFQDMFLAMKGLTDLNTLKDPLNQTSDTSFSEIFLKIKENIDTKDILTVDTLNTIFNHYKNEIELVQVKLEIISMSIDQIAAKMETKTNNAGIDFIEFSCLSIIAGIITATKKKKRK
ncbi:MAG: C39 family peptidase [Candidatus Hodarchaeales archaeon]